MGSGAVTVSVHGRGRSPASVFGTLTSFWIGVSVFLPPAVWPLGAAAAPAHRGQALDTPAEEPSHAPVAKEPKKPKKPKKDKTVENALQSLGPTRFAGRVRAIVVRADDPATIWVAAASGGLWVSRDEGSTWSPADDFLESLTFSSLVADPQKPDVMYAGSGEIHTFLHHLNPLGTTVSGIEGLTLRSPRRGAGIFKTLDGGTTWHRLQATNNRDFFYVSRIAVHPLDSNVLLAATATGLWRSEDGGRNWGVVPTLGGILVLDVKFHPADPASAVAATFDRGVFFSTDGRAVDWRPSTMPSDLPVGPGSNTRVELAPEPLIPGAWLAAHFQLGPSPIALIASSGGASFNHYPSPEHRLFSPLVCDYDEKDNPVPLQNNRLYTGALRVNFHLGDPSIVVGGTTLCSINNHFQTSTYRLELIHNDHHAIVDDGRGKLLIGNDGGMYSVSLISGFPIIESRNNKLGIQQFHGAARNPLSGVVVGGAQDVGTLRREPDPSGAWTAVIPGPEGGVTELIGGVAGSDGMLVATDPGDRDVWYYGKSGARIYRSVDGAVNKDQKRCIAGATAVPSRALLDMANDGAGCTPTNPPGCKPGSSGCTSLAVFNCFGPTPILLDPTDSNVLYAGCERLWRTRQAKEPDPKRIEWEVIKPISRAGVHFITTMAIASYDANVMWVGTLQVSDRGNSFPRAGGELWTTSVLHGLQGCQDGSPVSPPGCEDGTNWRRVSDGSPLPRRPISRVALHPTDPSRVYVSFWGWASADVSNVSDNLWRGVRLPDNSYEWTNISAGLPPGPIHSVIAHRRVDGWIYAGTDAGIYYSPNDGTTWSATTIGPARVPISDLSWIDDRCLLVSTYGRGIYTLCVGSNVTLERIFPERLTLPLTDTLLNFGRLENLLVSDERPVLVSTTRLGGSIALELTGRTGFSAARTAASTLSFTWKSSVSSTETKPEIRVSLFNFRTGTYVLLGQTLAPKTDTTLTVNVRGAADYIGPSRELRAQLLWVPLRSGSTTTFSARIDLASWSVSPP